MQKFKELNEHKNTLVCRAEEIIAGASEQKRELTDAEAQELAEIRDNVRKIKDALGIIDEIAEEEIEKNTKEEEMTDETRTLTEEEENFAKYIRCRALDLRDSDVNITPSAGSGEVLIPSTIAKKIIAKVYDICPVLEKSTKYNIKGTFEVPYYDESTTALTVAYKSEFSALTSTAGVFTNVTLSGYLAGCLTKISLSLINKTNFDLVQFVVNHMAEAMARFIEKELLVGTENKVAGLSGVTNITRASSVSAITADNLISLKDSVKDRFQNNAMWVMSNATRTALRKLKDSDGRYLLNDDITSPFGSVLLGRPVYVSDNMPEISGAGTVIYYGDFSGLTTNFTEEINIQILREKFADQHCVGVVGWTEFDGKVTEQQKLGLLTMAQS